MCPTAGPNQLRPGLLTHLAVRRPSAGTHRPSGFLGLLATSGMRVGNQGFSSEFRVQVENGSQVPGTSPLVAPLWRLRASDDSAADSGEALGRPLSTALHPRAQAGQHCPHRPPAGTRPSLKSFISCNGSVGPAWKTGGNRHRSVRPCLLSSEITPAFVTLCLGNDQETLHNIPRTACLTGPRHHHTVSMVLAKQGQGLE